MMKKKKLKYSVNRTLLTEFLPYETPIHFSNKEFLNFITDNQIKLEIDNNNVLTKTNVPSIVLELLFHEISSLPKDKRNICQAFRFKISHPKNIFRELSISHPRSQLLGISFYAKYKENILYNSTKQSFSLRYPSKVAQYVFYKDKRHYNALLQDKSIIEIDNTNSENVRSFFSYQRYSNISQFYDSEEFHKYEKEYNLLTKQDISKCFDSIYTHSLAWAIYGKDFTKNHLEKEKNKNTFHTHFDMLMSSMNFNETNGILIGSELSRIFSEIIFQSIDRSVIRILQEKYNLKLDIHYKVLRYVDDYFIFTNSATNQNTILGVLQHALSEFKLHLNTLKSETYHKPIITNISIAKLEISDLLDNLLKFNLEKVEINPQHNLVIQPEIKGNIYLDSQKLILNFKAILKKNQIEYNQIINYTFSILQNKLEEILKNYKKVTPKYRNENEFIISLLALIEFAFFIYTVAPQATTTTRLCRFISEILFFIKVNPILSDHKDLIQKQIYNNTKLVLHKNQISLFSQIETINLLLISVDLGKKYTFTEDQIIQYFNLNEEGIDLETGLKKLNYFSYTALLFYIQNKKQYINLKKSVCAAIYKKVESYKKESSHLMATAEYTMLLFDLLSCPYLDNQFKSNLLRLYKNIPNGTTHKDVLTYISNKKWFISWGQMNFRVELDKKIGLEVY